MLHIGHPILGDPLYPIPDHTPECSVTKKPRIEEPPNDNEDHSGVSPTADEYLSTLSPDPHPPEVAISSKCYPRLCLHALYIKFNHPVTKEVMEITAHEANMI